MALFCSLLISTFYHATIGERKKGYGGTPDIMHKKKSKWPALKSQHPPVYFYAIREDLSDLDNTLDSPVETVETDMSGVMDLLLDISSQLQTTEHVMEEAKSDRSAEAVLRFVYM